MSLLKLPFIVSVLLGIHTTMTPPHPPPSSDERMKPTGLEKIAPWFPIVAKVGGHKTIQAFFWAAAFFEICVVLAHVQPLHPVSDRILHLLVNDPDAMLVQSASRIRITLPFLIGWCINLVGALIRSYCYKQMGTQFTFELSIRKDHRLVTSGPYSVVRHPSYSGAVLAAIGTALAHLSSGSWLMECSGLISDLGWVWIWVVGVVVIVVALTSRIRKEDRMLKEEFGKEWEEWARRVPYRLFPGIY